MTEHAEQARLPEAERHRVLTEVLLPVWTTGAVPQDQPVLIVVAGPPGSGKTTTAEVLHAALSHRGGAVRIGSDLYKQAHREYGALLAADVRTAGVRVRPDVRGWQAEIEAYARAARLDVVLELALADADEARAVSRRYRKAGYWIGLVVLAVAEADSQLAVLERFFDGEGRYVGWDNQDACGAGLLDSLAVVEAERLTDRVAVVRRGLEPLYNNELTPKGEWIRTPDAAGAVRRERLLPWSAPKSRVFRHKLVRAEVKVHAEQLPADRRLAVSRDAERAAAAAEPVRRIAHPLPGPPGTGYHRLSQDEHDWIFEELIAPFYRRKAVTQADPLVVYLVGEPGARQAEAARMLLGAMRPGTIRLEPRGLRGAHPDYPRLVEDSPRAADELVDPDTQAWQTESEACIRELRGDLLIEAGHLGAGAFAASTGRFARAGYRIEVVVLAARAADSRQRTLLTHVRALELDMHTAVVTPAAHAAARRAVAAVTVAATADPAVAWVIVIDGKHQALGRNAWAPWVLSAAAHRPYTEGEAAAFHTVQRALRLKLPRLRSEIDALSAEAELLMPPRWRSRQVEYRAKPSWLPLPASGSTPKALLPLRR